MTDAVHETQLLRLADAIAGFREADACVALRDVPRESVRAALRDLASRGKLRESAGRYYRARQS
jgi:hypothetical protein